ncbi:MAG: SPOR domain-containing protein, partial [Syntrophaceae bacterium]|nr:SPOR domain-containing protein [Syntrophaceae bacterium]
HRISARYERPWLSVPCVLSGNSENKGEERDMPIPNMGLKGFQSLGILLAAAFLLSAGCASKTNLSSLSGDRSDFTAIKKVAVVLEDDRGHNPLFGDIFMESASEKMGPFLLQEKYVLRENIAGTDLRERVDAFLEIAVTHSNEGFPIYGFPMTFRASAKLMETATGKIVWGKDYAYRSAIFARSAPPIREVMKLGADTILDSIPLTEKGASRAEAAAPPGDSPVSPSQTSPPPEEKAAPQETAIPVKTPAESRQATEQPPAPQIRIVEKKTAPQAKAASPPDGQAMIFSVQAGAFLQKENATRMTSLLKSKGFSPYISEKVDSGKRVWHTVQVGKYATRSEAETAAKDISNKAGIATTLHLLK